MKRPFLNLAATLALAFPTIAAPAQTQTAPHREPVARAQVTDIDGSTIKQVAWITGTVALAAMGFKRAGIFRPGHVAAKKMDCSNIG